MKSVLPALLLTSCGLPDALLTGGTDAELGGESVVGRPYKRMDVDQLAASLERVTGFEWTDRVGGEDVDLFERLSGSLGKPEYLARTDEDLNPGLLFQKFLDDAAKSVCTRLVEAEAGRPVDERVFAVGMDFDEVVADEDGTDAAIRGALLLFHGRRYDPGATQVEPWTQLVSDVLSATGDPAAAWRGLCVGLIVHPDFYSY